MRIIRLYLLKEMFWPFLMSLLVSTVILTAGNMIQMADLIMNKGVSAVIMFQLLMYLMPSLLMLTIPISILSSVLLAFARLTSDNEIVALRASGISLFNIAAPIVVACFIISLASIPLNYQIMPEAAYKARKLLKEIGVKNPTALLEPGVFLKVFENYIIFIYDIKGNELYNVRIYQPQENAPTRTLVAEKGEIIPQEDENSIKIKLTNGVADETEPGKPEAFYKLGFKNYYLTLSLKETYKKQMVDKKTRELTYPELKKRLAEYINKKDDVTPILVELHNKIAFAFSNLIFALMAIPIGVKTHRREKSINFGLALVVFLVYWGIMLGGVALAAEKLIPVWLGVWSPNIIFLIVAAYLFRSALKR